MVMRSFALVQNLVSLVSFAVLLFGFSPWAVLLLVLAGLPGFIAEARVLQRRVPAVPLALARTAHAGLSRDRDRARRPRQGGQALRPGASACWIATRPSSAGCMPQDRKLAIRRDSWGFALGLLATLALYGGYCWVAVSAVHGAITVGQMTMYLMLFRQGQAAVSERAGRDQRPVRGQPLPLDAVRVPRYAGAARRWARRPRGPKPGDGLGSSTWGSPIRAPRSAGAVRHQPAPAAPGRQPGAGGRQRLRQDHADQAADAALRARLRGASCSTAGISCTGTRRRCARASA